MFSEYVSWDVSEHLSRILRVSHDDEGLVVSTHLASCEQLLLESTFSQICGEAFYSYNEDNLLYRDYTGISPLFLGQDPHPGDATLIVFFVFITYQPIGSRRSRSAHHICENGKSFQNGILS